MTNEQAQVEDKKKTLEFLWKVHAYTNDYIRFADPKAGIVVALGGSLIAALFGVGAHKHCSPTHLTVPDATWRASLLGMSATLGFFFLLGCALFGCFAVAPRLWTEAFKDLRSWLRNAMEPPAPGPIFFNSVLQHENGEEYWKSTSGMDIEELEKAVAFHVHALAGVANRKFTWIRRSILCGYVGAFFAILVLFLS